MASRRVAVSGLESHLGYWLRFVSNQVSHAFSMKLAARDVTVAEWVVLREMYAVEVPTGESRGTRRGSPDVEDEPTGAEPTSPGPGPDPLVPSDLAARLGMTRGAISKLVDRLEAKALVKRRSSPVDRRYQDLALSPSGRRLVPQLSALADQNDEEFFGHLTAAERSAIEAAMRGIVRRLGLRGVPVE